MIDGHAPTVSPRIATGPSTSVGISSLYRAFLAILLAVAVVLTPRIGLAQLPEDPPEFIPVDKTLTEEQDDHVEALALFAHGRVLLQRGSLLEGAERQEQLAAALRRFQRAWWFDHELVSIFTDIAKWSHELGRHFETTRYLIIGAEQQEFPTDLLEDIATQLARLDQFDRAQSERALRLYLKLKQRQSNAVTTLTQFQIGRLSLTLGKYTQAAEAFAAVQRALEQDDNERIAPQLRDQLLRRPDATYALFGESYLRAGQLDRAEAAFRVADQSKPNPATLAYRLALVENERGNSQESLELLQEYFDAKARSASLAPYVMLGELIDGPVPESKNDRSAKRDDGGAMKRRKPSKKLVEKLRQLAKADPSNALLGYFVADTLRRAEKWNEAVSLYAKLLKQDPAADGYEGLVDIYHRQRRFAPLLEQLAEVVSKTGSLEPLDATAEQIAQDGATLDKLAEQAMTAADDDDHATPDGVWLALALLYAKGNREGTEILGFLDRGLKHPTATTGQAAVNLAFAVFQSNQPEVAAKMFQRILDEKLLPERQAEVNYYLAAAWAMAKNDDRALAAAREAGRLEPNSPRMLTREPWILFQAKRLPEARTKYLELLDRFDADHTTLENREAMRDIRLALSAVEVELKDLASAEEWLQQTLDEFPENIGAYNDLGYLWADQGKHLQRSLRMVRTAVKAEPDNIAYLDSLGWTLYRLGRFTEALEPLEKAAADEDVDGVILDHLGDAYLRANQPDRAIDTWRKAAQAFTKKKDPDRLKAIQAKLEQHAQQ